MRSKPFPYKSERKYINSWYSYAFLYLVIQCCHASFQIKRMHDICNYIDPLKWIYVVLEYEVQYFQFTHWLLFDYYYVQSPLWDDWMFSIIKDRIRNRHKVQGEEFVISVSKDCAIVLNIYLSELPGDS